MLYTPTHAARRTQHGIQTPLRGPFPLAPPLLFIQMHGVPRAQAPSPQTHHPDVQNRAPSDTPKSNSQPALSTPPPTTFSIWLLRGTACSASTSPPSQQPTPAQAQLAATTSTTLVTAWPQQTKSEPRPTPAQAQP
jgi:hypothetical protein